MLGSRFLAETDDAENTETGYPQAGCVPTRCTFADRDRLNLLRPAGGTAGAPMGRAHPAGSAEVALGVRPGLQHESRESRALLALGELAQLELANSARRWIFAASTLRNSSAAICWCPPASRSSHRRDSDERATRTPRCVSVTL
jgi:hypothetical protein